MHVHAFLKLYLIEEEEEEELEQQTHHSILFIDYHFELLFVKIFHLAIDL